MKNSKKALENIKTAPSFMGGNSRYKSVLESRIPFLEDIEIVKQDLNRLEKLEKENSELLIKNEKLDTRIVALEELNNINRKITSKAIDENTKLKKVIKILEDNLQLIIVQDIDPFFKKKIYTVILTQFYKKYSGFEVTQEEYELLKEVLNDE